MRNLILVGTLVFSIGAIGQVDPMLRLEVTKNNNRGELEAKGSSIPGDFAGHAFYYKWLGKNKKHSARIEKCAQAIREFESLPKKENPFIEYAKDIRALGKEIGITKESKQYLEAKIKLVEKQVKGINLLFSIEDKDYADVHNELNFSIKAIGLEKEIGGYGGDANPKNPPFQNPRVRDYECSLENVKNAYDGILSTKHAQLKKVLEGLDTTGISLKGFTSAPEQNNSTRDGMKDIQESIIKTSSGNSVRDA